MFRPYDWRSPEEILRGRRETAETQMRNMALFRWRVAQDTCYSLRNESVDVTEDLEKYPLEVIRLWADRIYQGVPYTHAVGNLLTFGDYLKEVDDSGIFLLTIDSVSLNGGIAHARIGNACSGAVQMAWASVATSFTPQNCRNMTPKHGYLKVGSYEAPEDQYEDTLRVCSENGAQTMFESYAKLQKADAVVYFSGGKGHTMMTASVHVVRDESGSIDGKRSFITAHHQTSTKFRAGTVKTVDGKLTCPFYGLHEKFTFGALLSKGYLPITCKEFEDPAPVADWKVKDTITAPDIHNLFEGMLHSNYLLHSVTVTILAGGRFPVQQCTAYASREQLKAFPMNRFLTEDPRVLKGSLNLSDLEPGQYRCTCVAQIATGEKRTVRDFKFSVQ